MKMHLPSSMEKNEIVIFVTPLMGHLTPSIEMANLMLARNKRIRITILIIKLSITDSKCISKIESFMRKATPTTTCDRVRFHLVPLQDDDMHHQQHNHSDLDMISLKGKEFQKGIVREIVSKIQDLSGFIVDAGNTTMIDVANEFGVPSYVFFASGAAFLGLLCHFQALQDSHNQELSDLLKGRNEFVCPCFINPIPISLLPMSISWLVEFVYGCRKAKGILVNSFAELEANAFDSLLFSSHLYDGKLKMPPVYPVGPFLNGIHTGFSEEDSDILDWLNDKMSCSVVFLCFGSKGSLNFDQVKEIAYALEASGHSFLWSLRQPSAKEGGFPSDYGDYGGVLPKGFLDRTSKIGKVVGWVPQLAVLSHCAVGGFVSHCGWNSTLESIWCGVPMATWPLQGDQQLNAFQVVKELGVAVEITMDYDEKNENQELIKTEKIEKGIRKLMDSNNEGRRRVKELSRKSKEAMEEGGSSYLYLQNLLKSMTRLANDTFSSSCNGKPV